jgi:GNAT superfamily N-acetyltransferase
VGSEQLNELATLFATSRNTRRCWCTAPCGRGLGFALGWVTGSNARRFGDLAARGDAPMGVLASVGADPVGWCACGPRSRYAAATTGTPSQEYDGDVWFVPCLYVHPDHRGQGVTAILLRAAVDVATRSGATALEARPATGSASAGDAFRGRESVLAELGFRWTDASDDGAAVMRRPLR